MNKVPDSIMRYLEHVEGDIIHHNAGESDITSPYGIYRKEHPEAAIFTEIDAVALKLGIYQKSSEWTQSDIDAINHYIHQGDIKDDLKELVAKFYYQMTKPAHINDFPQDAQVSMFSMYTNSPKRAKKACQTAINTFVKNNLIENEMLKVDGVFGSKTISALHKIHNGLLFESYMLLHMSSLYARLAVKKPKKYLRYLNGWNNRLKELSRL